MRYAINNNWKFTQDFKEEYLNNILNSKEIQIPHTVKELPFNYFNINDYEMISTYQKILNYKVNENERLQNTNKSLNINIQELKSKKNEYELEEEADNWIDSEL